MFAVTGYPQGIVRAKGGDFWIADGDRTTTLSRITPHGIVTAFPIGYIPLEMTTDTAGNFWLTVAANLNLVIRVTRTLEVTSFTLTDDTNGGIMLGADGNIWFVENTHIGKLTPAGKLTEYPAPETGGESGLTWATGLVWFRTEGAGGLASLNPQSGAVTSYEAPISGGGAVVAGEGSLWCASGSSDGATPLVRFDLRSKKITTYSAPPKYDPYGAPANTVLASHGFLWYTSQRIDAGRVVGGGFVRFDIHTKRFTTYASPPGYGWQWDLLAAPDGKVWATSAAAIAVLDPSRP
jgi:virginiamycin B lyase